MKEGAAAFKEKIAVYEERDRERILQALSWEEKVPETTKSPGRNHALEIASILTDLNLDADTLIAALILNGGTELSVKVGAKGTELVPVTEKFGLHIAHLVDGAAKIADIQAKNKTIREAENIRKMLFAMAQDIRVIFIKLAEKLSTLRALDSFPGEEQKPAAQECLDIYAPLADRLGISWIKDELEDLSLKYLNREAYQQIKEIVAEKREERQEFLNTVQEAIRKEAVAGGFNIEVASRAKHFYSIYQKMRKRNKHAGDIYDLFGIRILCDNIETCYTLLGLVHRLWKPLEGRFKDYIAMPKSNGYQSLHTTVMSPSSGDEADTGGHDGGRSHSAEGRMLEIQIRTREMHHIAENGIASHWLYKKGTSREVVRPVDISIVNRLRNWKTETEAEKQWGSGSFLEDMKREILGDSIYVFTPQGKVIELPAGATPIDFAYSVHSAIGEHCVGARADGSIIPLSSGLQNTQVVEILTSPQAHPHLNWLRLVKTAKARSKIRSWLEQNDDSIIIEKNVVAKKKPAGPEPAPGPAKDFTQAKDFAPVQRVIQQNAGANILHVRVEDEKNLMIRFARCCRPITGDPIIGYVSRGRGIIIHRKNCSNLANIPDFEERKIETEWENAGSVLIKHFKIEARLSADLFSEIEGAVRKHQGHLIEGRLEETAANRLTGFFTMQLESPASLKRVIKNIRGIPGVYSIQTLNS